MNLTLLISVNAAIGNIQCNGSSEERSAGFAAHAPEVKRIRRWGFTDLADVSSHFLLI